MQYLMKAWIVVSLLSLLACTSISPSPSVRTQPSSRWGIAALTNNTEVPQAGNRAMSITSGVLRAKGVRSVTVYPSSLSCSKLIVCPNANTPVEQVLAWAETHQISYVMMGAVNEWDYKVGLDGEPAAAVTLQVYDVHTKQIIWSSVGSKIGTSRSSLGVIAQELIIQMLRTLLIA